MSVLDLRVWASFYDDEEPMAFYTNKKHLTARKGAEKCVINLSDDLEVWVDELIDELVNGEHEQYYSPKKVTPLRVEKFTGLNDKTGLPIYEGDIVTQGFNQPYDEGDSGFRSGIVSITPSTGVVTNQTIQSSDSDPVNRKYRSSHNVRQYCHIIGNIQDNPNWKDEL